MFDKEVCSVSYINSCYKYFDGHRINLVSLSSYVFVKKNVVIGQLVIVEKLFYRLNISLSFL